MRSFVSRSSRLTAKRDIRPFTGLCKGVAMSKDTHPENSSAAGRGTPSTDFQHTPLVSGPQEPPRPASRWAAAWPASWSSIRDMWGFGTAYPARPGLPLNAGEAPSETAGDWSVGAGLRGAVHAVDWALRERQGIFEYSRDPRCMLRISVDEITRNALLLDAPVVPAGSRIVDIHFWNERMAFRKPGRPRIATAEHSLRFAAAIRSRFELSLIQLSAYLKDHDEFADVAAIRAKFAYPIHADSEMICDVMSRFGFAAEPVEIRPRLVSAYLLSDLFLWLLAWSFNARGISGLTSIRRRRRRFWMSRKTLDTRYGSRARVRGRSLRAAGD